MKDNSLQKQKAETLLALHHNHQRPLILPNVWNPLGAALLADLGFSAVATSSSAVALTNGKLDGENISFPFLLTQLSNITNAVSLPVTADIEKGFALNDEELEQNVEKLIDAGIVGVNFEDGSKTAKTLVSIETQCKRIRIFKNVAERKGIPIILNARTDVYIYGSLFKNKEEQLQETIQRGLAYREAGADCFFPILVKDETAIQRIVEQVNLPVNIMTVPGIPAFKTLAEIGVKRISLGSSFLKIAMQAMRKEALLVKALQGQENIENNEITSGYLEGLIAKSK